MEKSALGSLACSKLPSTSLRRFLSPQRLRNVYGLDASMGIPGVKGSGSVL